MDFLDFFLFFLRIISIISIVLLIIFVHEMGHYLVGRWCGIKALVFSLGFGPELYSHIDKKGTKWRIALIPLGGYVRFLGDEEESTSLEFQKNSNCFESFFCAPAWKRTLIVFAGPLFNGIFSFFIFAFLYLSNGHFYTEPVLGEVIKNMPAYHAGFQKGDRILSINDHKIGSFEELSQYVSLEGGHLLKIVFLRNKQVMTKDVIPKNIKRETEFQKKVFLGTLGVRAPEDPNNPGHLDKRYLNYKKYNLAEAFSASFHQIKMIITQTFKVLGRLILANGDRCYLSGPTQTLSLAWQISSFGFGSLIFFMGFMSISVGFINLFPIPPLDGGHLFFYLWETIFRYPVQKKIKILIYKIGMFLLLCFMIFATLNDFVGCS